MFTVFEELTNWKFKLTTFDKNIRKVQNCREKMSSYGRNLCDSVRVGGWNWNVGTIWMEPCLVGHVLSDDGGPFGGSVGVLTLDNLGLSLRPGVPQEATCLSWNSIFSLEAVMKQVSKRYYFTYHFNISCSV